MLRQAKVMLLNSVMELQVLQALAYALPRRLLESTVLPLVASALQCGSVPMQLACLELALLSRLQVAASLAAFLRSALPAILSILVCDDLLGDDNGTALSAAPQVRSALSAKLPLCLVRHTNCQARSCANGAYSICNAIQDAFCCMQAGEVLCNAARSLPVPVILDHVVWPLLLSLARGPDAALALVGIGRTLGGALAAKHLLPPLLAVLASSGTVRQSWSGRFSSLCVSLLVLLTAPCSNVEGAAPHRSEALQLVLEPMTSSTEHEMSSNCCAAGEQREALASAMLGALTAVEGLLPVLAPDVILSQLMGPSVSPRGNGEQSAPTVPVQLLLAPDVHRLASPQMLNRVAGLLVQVKSSGSVCSCSVTSRLSHIELLEARDAVINCYAGNQGGWRQKGLLSGAAAAAAAAADMPCYAAVVIRCSAGSRQVPYPPAAHTCRA